MSRPEVRACCCKSHSPHSPSRRYRGVGENLEGVQNAAYNPDVDRRIPQYGTTQVNDEYAPIDPQTLNTISSLRKKACQFIRSESESSSSSVGHQCPDMRQYRGSTLLRNANNIIDYVPQSEFLKKMKQQCQYLQNDQPNIFSSLDNCEQFGSDECQRCIDRTKLILSVGDQIKCNKFKSATDGPSQNFPCHNQFRRASNLEVNEVSCRNPQNFCQMNGLNDNQRLVRNSRILPKGNLERISEELSEKILQKPAGSREKLREQDKKLEHMSRSKKPAKCRGRRKRKSDSSYKCESEDEFEPNLKKPHENSCERCWRYASPSRSPVNKPDQRYDPNFRRGHSCMDFNSEMGDGDLEVAGRQLSLCKNLQPLTSREKIPVSSRQQPEVIHQKTCLSPRKTQQGSQEFRFSQLAGQSGPRTAQIGPQKAQCIQQHPLEQDKHDTSFTNVKELIYKYSRSKSPDKNSPHSQPSEGCRKSPNSLRILQSETPRKARPKSYTAGAPVLDSENLPDYMLNVTDYCDICLKPKQRLGQNDVDKKSLRLSGNKGELPVGNKVNPRPATAGSPLKVGTPSMSGKPEFSPKASSTPKKSSKPKAVSPPDQCNSGPNNLTSPQPKKSSPKPKSPKTHMNLNFNKSGSQDSDATVYAEVVIKTHENPPTPKKCYGKGNKKTPSPKSKPKSGSSMRKVSKNGSPRRVQSSASIIENLSPIQEVKPQTVFIPPTEHGLYSGHKGMHDSHTGAHPIRECWCPPRAPFIKKNICDNSEPGQIFCCHCNWEENRKNEEQRIRSPSSPQPNVARNERPRPQTREVSQRQHVSDRKCGTCAPRPEPCDNFFLQSEHSLDEDFTLECPYRTFQREKRAANDTSWEADYQRLKEYSLRNPEEVNYQVTTKAKEPLKNSEYLPTKYAVFYMTENKKDKGDDVEVLVEELTQACPKKIDSRTKDITDKMKRILECPSDSMALRFQKGVSESCKTPRSSRILYF